MGQGVRSGDVCWLFSIYTTAHICISKLRERKREKKRKTRRLVQCIFSQDRDVTFSFLNSKVDTSSSSIYTKWGRIDSLLAGYGWMSCFSLLCCYYIGGEIELGYVLPWQVHMCFATRQEGREGGMQCNGKCYRRRFPFHPKLKCGLMLIQGNIYFFYLSTTHAIQ